MKLTYVGGFDAVSVPLPSGAEATCARNGTIEVPDNIGERLLEQADNWQPATPAKKEAKPDQSDEADAKA